MVTEAVITKKIDENTCWLHIPAFETVYDGKRMDVKGKITMLPGVLSTYSVNDKVWITFDENRVNQPIILCQIYEKKEEEASKKVVADIATTTLSPAINAATNTANAAASTATTAMVTAREAKTAAINASNTLSSLQSTVSRLQGTLNNINNTMSSAISCRDLTVNSSAILPSDTTITYNPPVKKGTSSPYGFRFERDPTILEIIDLLEQINRIIFSTDGYRESSSDIQKGLKDGTGLIEKITDLEKRLKKLEK